MKTTALILSTITMTLTSFNSTPIKKIPSERDVAAERMGLQVVTALQRQSQHEYSALYPTSESLLKLMDQHAVVYGDNFADAKRDFQENYQAKVIPSMNRSFFNILEAGRTEGLDWRTVKLSSVKVGDAEEEGTPVDLVLSSNGATFTIRYERTLTIDGQFKVSPFVKISM